MRAALAAALGSGLPGAAAAGNASVTGHHFQALVCVEIDERCAERAPLPGLLVPTSVPPTQALATMLRTALPAAGFELPLAAGAASAGWLVALGPLQAAGTTPLLISLQLRGANLVADIDYQPYTPVGPDRRRFVPTYPVALLALPVLAPGPLLITVHWRPQLSAQAAASRGAATTPTQAESLLGPLRVMVR